MMFGWWLVWGFYSTIQCVYIYIYCIYLYGISIIYELQIYQRVKEMLVLKAAQMKVPLKKTNMFTISQSTLVADM